MGRKDASTIKLPVDQYRKQIEKEEWKTNMSHGSIVMTKPAMQETTKKEVGLVLAALLALLLAFYAFFYLRLSTDVEPDLEPDED
ncbi:PREDICTED: triple QxxK/R motif-containing protein [Hipposideros armiger]|uniref:Triple QxxK/R motif-containing protein n=1 Tax=Hipposideros armiger TaxID=186990 RepID=A0A8B7Q4M1_HIPAR|nr:PREDICTED: triple QxxK/R motif-containing protein [Hipposideros armiger]